MFTEKKYYRDFKSTMNPKQNTGTIVLYSPDIDFCMSLRMLWQDQYTVITITDPEMLLTTVRAFQPDIVIADAPPSELMRRRFEIMKRENIHLHIMLLYVPRVNDNILRMEIRKLTDYMLSQPIDVTEVNQYIKEAMHTQN